MGAWVAASIKRNLVLHPIYYVKKAAFRGDSYKGPIIYQDGRSLPARGQIACYPVASLYTNPNFNFTLCPNNDRLLFTAFPTIAEMKNGPQAYLSMRSNNVTFM